ncbi:MAG: M20/M25/M40 family metallo-hydrolase [Maribacter sp.]|nr:M20/M25/M40 family metallo-hydrolase [Maribacter sp.]
MRQKKVLRALLLVLLVSSDFLAAQTLSPKIIKVAAQDKFPDAITALNTFLQIQNDGHYPDQIAHNLAWCEHLFSDLDFDTQVISTKGAPLLFAEKKNHPKGKTVLFYLQIDGQPVDPSEWDQPNPFLPVLKEYRDGNWRIIDFDRLKTEFNPDWRIFARSASDSKGPALSFITALQILKEKKIKPAYNVKVIMDFQEEMGSPQLQEAVIQNKNLLKADMLFIMDGTRHLSNLPTLTYGARGIATATLKVYGPRYALHSGQYGNFSPNPVFGMAKLLGGLKDAQGKVTLPGFYEGIVLSDEDKAMLDKIPENKDSLLTQLGIAQAEAIGNNYEEAMQFPSLNVRGLNAGWTGDEVRTNIPSEVTAEIDMRLVPESDGGRLMGLLKTYIEENGYHLVDSIPTDAERKKFSKLASFDYHLGSLPFRTEIDSEIGHFLNQALGKVFDDHIVNMRTTGGSQPIAPFISALGLPAVSIRIPNPDNSIHGPNENLRLGNFLEGIISCLAILNEPIK